MFKWVQLHFIPQAANDHQPHFLRLRVALGLLALITLLETTYLLSTTFVLPKSANFAAIFASVLVDQTNAKRTSDSLGMLSPNSKLEVAARLKAEDMAKNGYFSHNSPDGKTPWYWFEKAGYDYAAAGENLAVNYTDSKDVTEAWMNSPAHRANILNGNYSEIGIATAQGVYKGKNAIFVVQMFGRESVVARQINNSTSTASSLSGLITSTPNPITTKKTITPSKTQPKKLVGTVATTSVVIPSTTPATIQPPAPTNASSTLVAGAETQKLEGVESSFAESVIIPESSPTVVEKIVASPHRMTTIIYLILFAILTLAIGLAIFIKIHIQHRQIIMNGMLLLVLITAFIVLNAVLKSTQGVI